MAKPRHLPRAPIREALVDIQITPHLSFETVESLAKCLGEKLGQPKPIWQASFGFSIGQEAPPSETHQSQIGYRFDFDSHVLQCRTNGFTLSRLAPYETWEQMCTLAKDLWAEFREATNAQTVTRMAVRYINALPLPLPITDFSDYLIGAPQIPSALPQTLGGFLQRLVMVDQDQGFAAIVTQALDESQGGTNPNVITIFLDIDAFQARDLDANSDEVWVVLEQLREFKNRIFFENLTEKAAGLFE